MYRETQLQSKKRPQPGPQLVPVRFEFEHPTAIPVWLVESFNDWKPEAKTPLFLGGANRWKETNLSPGTCEHFRAAVWERMPDPRARESVPNPFDGRNSALLVTSPVKTGQQSDVSNLALKNTNQITTKDYEQNYPRQQH